MNHQHYSPYMSFSRADWAKLRFSTPLTIGESKLNSLLGINEQVSLQEVIEIYLPIVRLIKLRVDAISNLHMSTNTFLGRDTKKVPFVIGIAGSVAVGKSTTARILQSLLSDLPGHPKVNLVTTDGFLFPNNVLKQKDLTDKKGFPESYNLNKLLKFLLDIKSGQKIVHAPVYSHLYYDVVPNEYIEVRNADIIIIEGINVLQPPKQKAKSSTFVSDFFDLSLYVHAKEDDIKTWYLERFFILQKTAFQNPESYFHRYVGLSEEELIEKASDIWERINKKNLEINIKPTKYRADIILEKQKNHSVTNIKLRKI
ncbi:type I pantothenate kinase [Aquibacillus kalidii]|uniref:type I pantothenate kinase n=1 Tax=Aquibacillus kalidii TaxID=2762597 RepID=UPI001645A672|nr:type I pantothenate kinase [Aquibacillus kalidii]